MFQKVTELLPEQACFPGRGGQMIVSGKHLALGTYYVAPFPSSTTTVLLGMGCFWGAERLLWQLDGVYTTAVGYAGGSTKNPSYEEVCSGYTNHAEVVMLVYQPELINLAQILRTFWQSHDPTQGMQQGNDKGTQYRSAIYVPENDLDTAKQSCAAYQSCLDQAGLGTITTEIKAEQPFYYAEDSHQQYLHTHPDGYCGLAGLGVTFSE